MFNSDNYVYFVSKRRFGAPYGFTTYTTQEGDVKMISYKKDKEGNPIPHKFKFSRKERVMRIPKLQKDVNGNSTVEFLRNHPECEGSPNNAGQAILFKELNEGKDADLAIVAKKSRIDAENKALALEGQDLEDICSLIGVFSSDPSIQKHRVLEFAGNEPDLFLTLYNSPDRKIKSLIRKAVSINVLTKRGTLITWDDEIIGSDEAEAVARLAKDKKLQEAIDKAVKRTK